MSKWFGPYNYMYNQIRDGQLQLFKLKALLYVQLKLCEVVCCKICLNVSVLTFYSQRADV